MAETGDGGDGKYIGPPIANLTGAQALLLKGAAVQLTPSPEIRPAEGERPSELIDPEKLYKYYSPAAGRFEVEAPVAMISQIIGSALERVRQARHEPDELARENHLAIALENFCGLSRYIGIAPSFDEVLSMVLVCIAAHRTSPYGLDELVALETVFEKLKRAPIPAEEDIGLVYDILDRAGFDLNAPIAGIDLDGEPRRG